MKSTARPCTMQVVLVAILCCVSLLTANSALAVAWYLPDTEDKSLAEEETLIEQWRLSESLKILDADDSEARLSATGPERGRQHYLRAFVLYATGKRTHALEETTAALGSPGFKSDSIDQARTELLRSWLYMQAGDWLSASANVNNAARIINAAFSKPHPARTFAAVTVARAWINAYQRPASRNQALGYLMAAQKEVDGIAERDFESE
jgi:hypothetical protein